MQIIREAMELSESQGLFDELREQMLKEQEEAKVNYSLNRKERRKQAALARRSAEKASS